jgi:hypothetical protein
VPKKTAQPLDRDCACCYAPFCEDGRRSLWARSRVVVFLLLWDLPLTADLVPLPGLHRPAAASADALRLSGCSPTRSPLVATLLAADVAAETAPEPAAPPGAALVEALPTRRRAAGSSADVRCADPPRVPRSSGDSRRRPQRARAGSAVWPSARRATLASRQPVLSRSRVVLHPSQAGPPHPHDRGRGAGSTIAHLEPKHYLLMAATMLTTLRHAAR